MVVTYNVYCDESCHLEHDCQPIMVLGAAWCPLEKTKHLSSLIREIKVHHGLSPNFEIKWNKVSPAKYDFYQDIVDCFFNEQCLHFRALVATDKQKLQHELFGQDHDTWYYKMYFELLKVIFDADSSYRIFLDIKDTRSADKVRNLQEVLCNNIHDFDHRIIPLVQNVRSHEVELLQVTDLLIGIVSYINRGLDSNKGKARLAEHMQQLSGYKLNAKTALAEKKVNIFLWQPSEKQA